MTRKYSTRTSQDVIDRFEKLYPWFKDVEFDDIRVSFVNGRTDGRALISGGEITKGALYKAPIVYNSELKGRTAGNLSKSDTMESAKNICGIHIFGGTFSGCEIRGCYVMAGAFTKGCEFYESTFEFNGDQIRFNTDDGWSNGWKVICSDCVIDEVSDYLFKHNSEMTYKFKGTKIFNVVVGKKITEFNMVFESCEIMKGNEVDESRPSYYRFDWCRIHNFISPDIEANSGSNMGMFTNCELINCDMTECVFIGEVTKIQDSTCTKCTIATNSNKGVPPVNLMFGNSTWNGGIFTGVFGDDSKWVSGQWGTNKSKIKGIGKANQNRDAMFGAHVQKDVTDGYGVTQAKKRYYAIPSPYMNPNENPELMDVVKRLSSAMQKHIDGGNNTLTDAMDVASRFRTLLGVASIDADVDKMLPISGMVLSILDLSESDKERITDAMSMLVNYYHNLFMSRR